MYTEVMAQTYEFTINLYSTWYDENDNEREIIYGSRKHVGTEETAIAAAKRTRTQASSARISRVAVSGGARFRDHEIKSFTIGI